LESATNIAITFVIFVSVYLLISLRKIPKIHLDRTVIVLIGASLVVILKILSPHEAIAAIELNTLILLLGLMIVVVGLELCGFFTWITYKIIYYSKNQCTLLFLVMSLSAFLSAIMLNDAVVLLLTPIIIHTAKKLKINPIPYLIGEAIAANIGSVATEVGNPQVAYIAMVSGIPFLIYLSYMAPIAIISFSLACSLVFLIYWKSLSCELLNREEILENISNSMFNGGAMDKKELILFKINIGIVIVLFVGFVLSSLIGFPLSDVAIGGGILVLLTYSIIAKYSAKEILSKVDWSIILFFGGLFVLLKAVEKEGMLTYILSFFPQISQNEQGIIHLALLTAILSNIVSNVPAVILLTPLLLQNGSIEQWLILASASTLAGNLTFLGSAANVIVLETSKNEGVHFSPLEFLKAGFPITIITLFVSTLIILLCFT